MVYDLRHNVHSVTDLKAHLVWIPKYREDILKFNIRETLDQLLPEICKNYKINLIEHEITADHVHAAIEYHPSFSISRIMNIIKGITSHELRDKYSILKDFHPSQFWAPGYCGISIGNNLDVVKKYIQNQNQGA